MVQKHGHYIQRTVIEFRLRDIVREEVRETGWAAVSFKQRVPTSD